MDEDGGIWIFTGKGMGITGIVCVVIAVFVIGGLRAADKESSQRAVDREMRSLEKSVEKSMVEDALAQWRTTQRGGDKMDVCVHAGLVTAALINAKVPVALSKWKPIEAYQCAAAGVANDGILDGAGTPCTVPQKKGTAGVCMRASACGAGFSSHAGRCPGSSTMRCCVPDSNDVSIDFSY